MRGCRCIFTERVLVSSGTTVFRCCSISVLCVSGVGVMKTLTGSYVCGVELTIRVSVNILGMCLMLSCCGRSHPNE